MSRPSPLQNRVLPDGTITALPARGTLMGNRGGRLHGADHTLIRHHASKQWITCLLSFKNRHRTVMGAGYTELFFLDEVTALAAGHRPCFECRRTAALAFAQAWSGPNAPRARAPQMDSELHIQRRSPADTCTLGDLPTGAMFTYQTRTYAQHASGPRLWSPEGYRVPVPVSLNIPAGGSADPATPATLPPDTAVTALTPRAIRQVLSAGYAPVWHPSAASPAPV